MKSLKRHEGWLLIDHSASPGIPADVARKIGFHPEDVSEGKKAEFATLSCSHCPGVWRKNPHRHRPRGYCRLCDHYVCDGCAKKMTLPDYVHVHRYDLMNAAMGGKIIIP